MTVWWGLAGLLGLLGLCGLLRSHRADGTVVEDDPLARYPVAREPATPNADAAHTPLMTPAITPEMLARPALPRAEAAVPESGSIAGEIPAPRPVGDRPMVPEETPAAGVSAGSWGGVPPGGAADGVSAVREGGAAPVAAPAPVSQPQPQPQRVGVEAGGAPGGVQSAAAAAAPQAAAQPMTAPAPVSQAQPAEVGAPHPRTGDVPQQPKHALRAEEAEQAEAPNPSRAPQTRPAEEPPAPSKTMTSPPEGNSHGLVGKLRRLLRGT